MNLSMSIHLAWYRRALDEGRLAVVRFETHTGFDGAAIASAAMTAGSYPKCRRSTGSDKRDG